MVVSEKLHVDPSFVTTQSKSLEKHGFMRRIPSVDDARVVLMSLTDKACKQIASLSSHQERLNDFIFADLDDHALGDITGKLTMLKNRIEKASLRFAAELYPSSFPSPHLVHRLCRAERLSSQI